MIPATAAAEAGPALESRNAGRVR